MKNREFNFSSSGRRLSGTLTFPDVKSPPVTLLCHGFGSYDDDVGAFVRMAERLSEAGIASLRFSFSGSDPYEDKGTILPASEWLFDVLAAIRALGGVEDVDVNRLGLVGMSMGGAMVIQAAALDTNVRAVVACCPVSDGYEWLKARWLATRGQEAWDAFVAEVRADGLQVSHGEASRIVDHFDVQAFPSREDWEQALSEFPRLLSHLSLASVSDTFCVRAQNFVADVAPRPLLIIQGDNDESVPIEQTRALFERAGAGKSMNVIEGAPHCFWGTEYEPRVLNDTADWLSQSL